MAANKPGLVYRLSAMGSACLKTTRKATGEITTILLIRLNLKQLYTWWRAIIQPYLKNERILKKIVFNHPRRRVRKMSGSLSNRCFMKRKRTAIRWLTTSHHHCDQCNVSGAALPRWTARPQTRWSTRSRPSAAGTDCCGSPDPCSHS